MFTCASPLSKNITINWFNINFSKKFSPKNTSRQGLKRTLTKHQVQVKTGSGEQINELPDRGKFTISSKAASQAFFFVIAVTRAPCADTCGAKTEI